MLKKATLILLIITLFGGCQGNGNKGMDAIGPSAGTPEDRGLPPTTLKINPNSGKPENYTGIPGSTPPESTLMTQKSRRLNYINYIVAARRLEEGGESIGLYRRDGENLGDLIYRFEEPYIFFAGMYGKHILIEQGTEKDMRTVSVYDVTAPGKPMLRFKAHHHTHQLSVEDNHLVFYGLLPNEEGKCTIDDPLEGTLPGRPFNEFHFDFELAESKLTGEQLCLFVVE